MEELQYSLQQAMADAAGLRETSQKQARQLQNLLPATSLKLPLPVAASQRCSQPSRRLDLLMRSLMKAHH